MLQHVTRAEIYYLNFEHYCITVARRKNLHYFATAVIMKNESHSDFHIPVILFTAVAILHIN